MSTGKHSGRGGKQSGRGGKVVLKHRETSQVAVWLNTHKEDLTVELCLEKWTQQQDMMTLINELIDMTSTNPQFLDILKELKPHFPGRVKHTGGFQYNPFHKINWLSETTDPIIISELYNIIHDVGYDVFMKNKQNEDAFLSLLKKFKLNREDPNYIFRYNQLVKFSKNEINKMITSIFNKIENINPEMIENVHVLLLQDYHAVLKRMADAMVLRKIPSQCNAFDPMFFKYVEGILKILSGAKNSFTDLAPAIYCDQEKTIPTFDLFFKQNESVLPDITQLVKLLWEYVTETALQSTGEYKNLNLEALGIVIGGFVETNRLYDQYKDFVLQCLNQNPVGLYANINSEIRLRMALRAIIQSKQEIGKALPQDILYSLKAFPYPATYYQVIIEEFLGPHHSTHAVQVKSIIPKIGYFGDLDKDNIDETVEYALEKFTEQMKSHPSHKSTIIQNFVASLLENMMPKYTMDQLKQISKYLVNIKKELLCEKVIIERNVITDLKPDIPYCDKVWKDLIKVMDEKN
ncbi:hypothetical protein Klosneuvirus_1_375 [Klosneuvirus KNV1]|uniref:Uncharacterized protein n=1 Tax=Klosneuvirus KNV1 TaxID=1977640 RepID=A0A1V0SIR1_9VIRU|nr:hypothetical protein Klosneuvirus_1_375 [Klosneuvirus KNV1]